LSAPLDLETRLHVVVQDWRLGIFIIALAILQQCIGHLNWDTAWFLTFAEKYLAGFEPYVDVSDPNPPVAFLAYVPTVGGGTAAWNKAGVRRSPYDLFGVRRRTFYLRPHFAQG
jgi:hypothetical protein